MPTAPHKAAPGFTMVELLSTLVIIGVLMAVAVPRILAPSPFKVRALADEIAAEIRYTQQLNMNYDANATFRIQDGEMFIDLPAWGDPPSARRVLRSGQGDGTGLYAAYRTIDDIAPDIGSFEITFDRLGRPVSMADDDLKVSFDEITSCILIIDETGFVDVRHNVGSCP